MREKAKGWWQVKQQGAGGETGGEVGWGATNQVGCSLQVRSQRVERRRGGSVSKTAAWGVRVQLGQQGREGWAGRQPVVGLLAGAKQPRVAMRTAAAVAHG